MLPPPLQQEFLANDQTLHYFALAPAATPPNRGTAEYRRPVRPIFVLTPAEKDQVLGTLSEAERATMQKTLKLSVNCRRNNAPCACATTPSLPA